MRQINNINVLIVIYNKSLKDSLTFKCLKNVHNIEVFIADNSTIDYGNEASAYELGYHYLNMGGNIGLSKAYNRVISLLEKTDDVICLFDDDTIVDSYYFQVLSQALYRYPGINVFAPIIIDQVGMLSPCILDGVKGIRAKKVSQIPQDRISVINSGLAVRLRVYIDYSYDEGFFLDYVDHAFIRDVIKNDRSKILIMENTTLHQCFSANEKPGKEADLKRFDIYKKDILYFCKKYNISLLSAKVMIVKYKLRLLRKYL